MARTTNAEDLFDAGLVTEEGNEDLLDGLDLDGMGEEDIQSDESAQADEVQPEPEVQAKPKARKPKAAPAAAQELPPATLAEMEAGRAALKKYAE